MENQNISVNVPLLENPPSRTQPTYLKTGFFDTFLLFWAGKIVDVTESYYHLFSFLQIGNRKTFQQDMHWNLREQESSRFLAHNLAQKFNQNKGKGEPLLRALMSTTKGSRFLDIPTSQSPLRNIFPCYVLLYSCRSSSIQWTFIDSIYHRIYY